MDPQAPHTKNPEIPEQDPAHDIDGRKAWTWLLGCTAGVFLVIWILSHISNAVIHDQRVKKIEMAPTEQLDQLRAVEDRALSAGEDRKSVDAAIADYLDRNGR